MTSHPVATLSAGMVADRRAALEEAMALRPVHTLAEVRELAFRGPGVAVTFWAPWAPASERTVAALRDGAATSPVPIVTANVDEAIELVRHFAVVRIPATIRLDADGTEVARTAGPTAGTVPA